MAFVGRDEEVTLTVDAARSCSRADWGKRILSPGNVLLLFGATLNTADHVRVISGVVMMVKRWRGVVYEGIPKSIDLCTF